MAKYSTGSGGDSAGGSCELCGSDGGDLQIEQPEEADEPDWSGAGTGERRPEREQDRTDGPRVEVPPGRGRPSQPPDRDTLGDARTNGGLGPRASVAGEQRRQRIRDADRQQQAHRPADERPHHQGGAAVDEFGPRRLGPGCHLPVEGERFDRRLVVYETLREQGVAPKTGFKFGADFRTYAAVEDVENLGHSELLVRVFDAGHVFEPRDLALDVRLAHGVRKTMAYAFVGEGGDDEIGIEWLAVERLTP